MANDWFVFGKLFVTESPNNIHFGRTYLNAQVIYDRFVIDMVAFAQID